MAGKQTRRVIVNVTEEQFAAVNEALKRYGIVNKNDELCDLLGEFCASAGVEWPEYEKQEPVRGKDGKFTKG